LEVPVNNQGSISNYCIGSMDKNITALEGNNGTRVYYDDGTIEQVSQGKEKETSGEK